MVNDVNNIASINEVSCWIFGRCKPKLSGQISCNKTGWNCINTSKWGLGCLMYWDLIHHGVRFTNLDNLLSTKYPEQSSPISAGNICTSFVFRNRINYKCILKMQQVQPTAVTVVLSSNQIGLLIEYYTLMVNDINNIASINGVSCWIFGRCKPKLSGQISCNMTGWNFINTSKWGFGCLMYWDLIHHGVPFTNLDHLLSTKYREQSSPISAENIPLFSKAANRYSNICSKINVMTFQG